MYPICSHLAIEIKVLILFILLNLICLCSHCALFPLTMNFSAGSKRKMRANGRFWSYWCFMKISIKDRDFIKMVKPVFGVFWMGTYSRLATRISGAANFQS